MMVCMHGREHNFIVHAVFYRVTFFFKLSCAFGLHYTVTILARFLVLKAVPVLKSCTFFPNAMPIPVLYPNHTGVRPNIYRYWYDVEKHLHTSMGFQTGMAMPVRV